MKISHQRFLALFLIVLLILGSAPIVALADNGALSGKTDSQDLLNKIKDLEKRNRDLDGKTNQLENRLQQLEAAPGTSAKVAPAYSPPKEGGFLRAAQDINISGYLESSYSLNTRRPSTGGLNDLNTNRAGIDALRSFDRLNDSFTVNGLALFIEKQAPETGGVGFRSDLLFGEDAKLLNALTTGAAAAGDSNESNVYIVQAYATLRAPYGNGIDFQFGKYASLYGFETAYSKYNWLESRGLLFNWGAPYTETGVRASYQWSDKLKTTFGVANGGNQDVDVNTGKSIEAKVDYDPTDRLHLSQALYLGQDTPAGVENGQHGQNTFILDSIAKYRITDKWTTAVESIWANSYGGQWYGIGNWHRYEFNDWIAFAARFEYFSDSSHQRLGAARGQAGNQDGYDAYEVTFGTDFTVYKDLLARLEYRVDSTPGADRFDLSGSNQSTFLASLIYSF